MTNHRQYCVPRRRSRNENIRLYSAMEAIAKDDDPTRPGDQES